MRKLFVALFFVAVIAWASQGVLMKISTTPTGEARYQIVKEMTDNGTGTGDVIKLVPELHRAKGVAGSNYTINYWGNETYYYWPMVANDTTVVRFEPPARCSLVAWSMYFYGFGDTNTSYFAIVNKPSPYWEGKWDNFPLYNVAYTDTPPIGTELYSVKRPYPGWKIDTIILTTPIDVVDSTFFCGYVAEDTMATISSGSMAYQNVSDAHSYTTRRYYGVNAWRVTAWDDGTKTEYAFDAYVIAYTNLPPTCRIDLLPYSYTTGPRTVYMHSTDIGIPAESTGVQSIIIYYQVNGSGTWNSVNASIVAGDSADGWWAATIPGVNAGDYVDYYAVATDYQGNSYQTLPYEYVILSGTAGNWLWIHDNYASWNPNNAGYSADEWDVDAYGTPDSAVLDYYIHGGGTRFVFWNEWSPSAIGYLYYGSGVAFTGDSVYIKDLLDNDGGFWLMAQDGAAGVDPDVWGDYGTHPVPSGSWLDTYLGLATITDDGSFAGAGTLMVAGNPDDDCVGFLFDADGIFPDGMIYLSPYLNAGRNWTGVFDDPGTATADLLEANTGSAVGVRKENIGANSGGKYAWHLFKSEDIVENPGDTLFYALGQDSFYFAYLTNFFQVGVPEEPITPGLRVVKVSNPYLSVSSGEIMLSVTLPEPGYLRVDIHDLAGRKVATAYASKVKAGRRPVRWVAKKEGTYFVTVYVNGEKKATRKVVVLK